MTGTAGFRNARVRVLIVDDEPALTDVLSVAVEEAGRRACPALDGQSALRIARGCPPHAVVLDGMLPELAARDALEHRLDGLDAGADDYVTKPFSLEDVVLRLRGPLRRAGTERYRSDESVRVLGALVLTEESREVHRAGVPVQLAAKEFDLLSLMMGHPRQVLGKAQVLEHVWSSSVRGLGYARPVEDGR
ncbi:response regulator transcription factor [Streptomyces sp. AS02]|uniref:response regulator transcription factor n=1 Tax=Streptomyces sp. AS02 TaxID=2938946 RepID=UPI0020216DA4|nr:response regulator transcription factor [Streptomyces sp. AS02]MCL8014220.1 response regulator transcription factor [Streptomyces sp. AS02]